MLVPRDPEVTVRAPDAIVASLEEQVKRWNTPEEQEDDYYTAVAKKPRMEDKRSELWCGVWHWTFLRSGVCDWW